MSAPDPLVLPQTWDEIPKRFFCEQWNPVARTENNGMRWTFQFTLRDPHYNLSSYMVRSFRQDAALLLLDTIQVVVDRQNLADSFPHTLVGLLPRPLSMEKQEELKALYEGELAQDLVPVHFSGWF